MRIKLNFLRLCAGQQWSAGSALVVLIRDFEILAGHCVCCCCIYTIVGLCSLIVVEKAG